MNLGKVFLVFVFSVIVAAVVVGGCIYGGYNRAIALDESVKNAWAEVDNQLQRRFELIPNVVETVKGLAGQEKDIYLGVAEARKAYFQAQSVSDKAVAAGTVESALSRLLLLHEKYPELRSNEAFLNLQHQLEGTENRLAVARQRYNQTVRDLNTFARGLVRRLYAALAGVEKAEYFEPPTEAKTVPKVSFPEQGKSGG